MKNSILMTHPPMSKTLRKSKKGFTSGLTHSESEESEGQPTFSEADEREEYNIKGGG